MQFSNDQTTPHNNHEKSHPIPCRNENTSPSFYPKFLSVTRTPLIRFFYLRFNTHCLPPASSGLASKLRIRRIFRRPPKVAFLPTGPTFALMYLPFRKFRPPTCFHLGTYLPNQKRCRDKRHATQIRTWPCSAASSHHVFLLLFPILLFLLSNIPQ